MLVPGHSGGFKPGTVTVIVKKTMPCNHFIICNLISVIKLNINLNLVEMVILHLPFSDVVK